MKPIELGRLPYSSPVVQSFLCILVLTFAGVVLFGLKLNEAKPDEQKQGLAFIGVVCLGFAIWTVHTLKRFPLRITLGEEITVRTFLGTSIFAKSEVSQISVGLLDNPRSGYFAPVRKPNQAYPVVTIQLNSGQIFTGHIQENDVARVEEYLRTESTLDITTIEQFDTPRAFMKQFVECVTEEALANSHTFFSLPTDHDFEYHAERAYAYAIALKDLIDEHWFIDFEEISDSPDTNSPYLLAQTSSEPLEAGSLDVMRNIMLEREPESGIWRFGGQTVNFIREQLKEA